MALTIQQTQDQRRAADAWKNVASVKSAGFAKKYKSLVKNAPADIQTSGLAQTVAFWRSKQKEESARKLYQHVSTWMMTHIGMQPGQVQASSELHMWILNASTDQYRRATVEALAYLGWMKRFVEAEIQGEDNS